MRPASYTNRRVDVSHVHPRTAGGAPDRDVVDPRPIAHLLGARGVLLLHGLTGTPHEVRPMADALREAGFAVSAPLLAGHTDVAALERSTWRDWYDTALRSFEELRDDGRRAVAVLGFSMGALLGLRLAALRGPDVDAAVAMSVPLRLASWKRQAIVAMARLRHAPVLGSLVGVLPKTRGPDVRVKREGDDSPSIRGLPYPTLAEFVALQQEVDDLLPHVRVPLLLLHGALDHTASPRDSEFVAQRVASPRVERAVLPDSFHMLGRDLDRDRVCAQVVDFVTSVLGEG